MTVNHSTEEIERAKSALTRPGDFGYSGDLPLFETWGLTGPTQHRDSGPLDQSNFETIFADLEERFPDDVQRFTSNHWAVGWAEQLAVRVLEGDYQPALPPTGESRKRSPRCANGPTGWPTIRWPTSQTSPAASMRSW